MEALNALPDWVKIVGALLAAGLLVVLNIGWLLQAKAYLDGQRRRYEERQRQQAEAMKRAADDLAATRTGGGPAADRDPSRGSPGDRA